jgi:hypothetical protein
MRSSKLAKLAGMNVRDRRSVCLTTHLFKFCLSLAVLLNAATGHLTGQVTVTWDELGDVTFESRYDEDFGIEILEAEFGTHLVTLDSQVVILTGYMIPLNALGTSYVLSRFPNANCFFCGGAGPETIVELKLSPRFLKRYATDTYATFKGRLILNRKNLTSLTYVMLDAERVD